MRVTGLASIIAVFLSGCAAPGVHPFGWSPEKEAVSPPVDQIILFVKPGSADNYRRLDFSLTKETGV